MKLFRDFYERFGETWFVTQTNYHQPRTPEPELMLDAGQAEAYAKADFSTPHQYFVQLCQNYFGNSLGQGWVLDLGCGPGDVTFRFARAFPETRTVAVDASPAMLQWGIDALKKDPFISTRIQFMEGYLPEASIPRHHYAAIISNSLLHHLPDPFVLWQTLLKYGLKGTQICIQDLRRPETELVARQFMEKYAAGEPEVLRKDFYNSLLAAFTPEEVREQLNSSGLAQLTVEVVSDRHMLICGTL